MTSLGAFSLTQVVTAQQSLVQGYSEAFCPGSSSYPYVPPTGWTCNTCNIVGTGTNGGCNYCVMVYVSLTPNSPQYYLNASDIIGAVPPTPPCAAHCSGTMYYGCDANGNPEDGTYVVGQCGCTCTSSMCDGTTYYQCLNGVLQTGVIDSPACGFECVPQCIGTVYYGCDANNNPKDGVYKVGQCGCTCTSSTCDGTTYIECANGVTQTGVINSPSCGYSAPTCSEHCSGTVYFGCTNGTQDNGVYEVNQCGCTCTSSTCDGTTYYQCLDGVEQTGVTDSALCGYVAPSGNITLAIGAGAGLLALIAIVMLSKKGGGSKPVAAPQPPS